MAEIESKNQKKDAYDDYKNEPIPYIITMKRRNQPTTIQSVNLLFSVLFSFSKEEIAGKEL